MLPGVHRLCEKPMDPRRCLFLSRTGPAGGRNSTLIKFVVPSKQDETQRVLVESSECEFLNKKSIKLSFSQFNEHLLIPL